MTKGRERSDFVFLHKVDSLCLGFNGAADFYAVVALNHIDARGSHRFPFPITLRANRRKALGPRLVLLLQTPLSAPALRGAALPPIRHTAERPGEQGSHVEPSGARRAPIGPGEKPEGRARPYGPISSANRISACCWQAPDGGSTAMRSRQSARRSPAGLRRPIENDSGG